MFIVFMNDKELAERRERRRKAREEAQKAEVIQ